MRKKVRGLRDIERQVLDDRRQAEGQAEAVAAGGATEGEAKGDVGQVVLDYCCAVRGILNDDQGGPLHPPGLRMAEALAEVDESLRRNLGAKKGGAPRSSCGDCRGASSAASPRSRRSKGGSGGTSRK